MKRRTKFYLAGVGIAVISIINIVFFIQPAQFLNFKRLQGKEKYRGNIKIDTSNMIYLGPEVLLTFVEKWSWNVTPKILSGNSALLKLNRKIQIKTGSNYAKREQSLLKSYKSLMGKIRVEGDFQWHSPQEQDSSNDQWNWNFTASTPGEKLIQIVLPPIYGQMAIKKQKTLFFWEREIKLFFKIKSNLESRFIVIPIIVSRFGLHPHIENLLLFLGWVIGILFTAPILVEVLKTKFYKRKNSSKKIDKNQISRRCQGTTISGKKCKRKTTDVSGYCKMHKRNG
jgi:hypothetical protein